MEILKYVILFLISVTIFIILIFALKSRKFFSLLFSNAILGWSAIAIIDLTSKFTGVYIPINCCTVSASGIFGTPAVIGLLMLNFIFI